MKTYSCPLVLNYTEFLHLDEKTTGEIYSPQRMKPTLFDPRKNPEITQELYDLIATAYAAVGGHAKVKSYGDVLKDPDWNWWRGIDIHNSSDFDLVVFGAKTRYGIKFVGTGHDGTSDAKKEYIRSRVEDLNDPGYYIEASGKLADILLSREVPEVTESADVERVLGKPVEWLGKGSMSNGSSWYVRKIGGHPHEKIMLGRPRV